MKEEKLEIFNTDTVIPSDSYIQVNKQSGHFSLSGQACKELGLSVGDKVSFAQSKETRANWYVYKDEIKGFELKGKERNYQGLRFNNTSLARSIVKSQNLGDDVNFVKLEVGKQDKTSNNVVVFLLKRKKLATEE